MRFTVVAYGSEGDTRPIAAVCRGLMDAGHEVTLFGEQSAVETVRKHGISAQVLTGDVKATLPLDNPSRELSKPDILRSIRRMSRLIRESTRPWMQSVADHARTTDAILFSGLASAMAQAVAEELHKPAIQLWLQPTTPTREFPSPMLPPLSLPGWLNRFTYHLLSPHAMLRRAYGKAANAARRQLFRTRSHHGTTGSFPILYGFSRHLVRRPNDWPNEQEICGHWELPPLSWRAPSELLQFLSAGGPPIYVGFGAASFAIRKRGLTEIISAIGGRRALFYPGWSKISADMLPPNFFVVSDTPHSWLFPQTSMVIHHCGAGTTHTASRAGVPSVGLPLGGDQLFWAGRLALAGVAPKHMSAAKVEAKSLARMIEFAERDEVRARAKALGAAMAEENGVAAAVQEIETLLR